MENSKRIELWGNVAFAVLILVSDIIFMCGIVPKYFIKTLASALFVLCGVFNLILCKKFYKEIFNFKPFILLAGLVFAFLGDVLLIDYFVIGAIFFAIGHIFFLCYFISLYKITLLDCFIAIGIFISALLLILLFKGFEFNGMKILVIVYALIISLMLGKALGTMITNPTNANLVMGIGAFLFFFSDLMLLFDVFANMPKIFDYLCLITYYPAEFLLALTILLQSKELTNIRIYENNKQK